MNPQELIDEYTAAFRAANLMNNPPDISYAKGWFTFRFPRGLPRKHRHHAVESMRDNLLRMAAEAQR